MFPDGFDPVMQARLPPCVKVKVIFTVQHKNNVVNTNDLP